MVAFKSAGDEKAPRIKADFDPTIATHENIVENFIFSKIITKIKNFRELAKNSGRALFCQPAVILVCHKQFQNFDVRDARKNNF